MTDVLLCQTRGAATMAVFVAAVGGRTSTPSTRRPSDLRGRGTDHTEGTDDASPL